MPDLVPGPMTVKSSVENQRFAIRRSCVLAIGEDEEIAIALTALRSQASRSSSCVSTSRVRPACGPRPWRSSSETPSRARRWRARSPWRRCFRRLGSEETDDGLGVTHIHSQQHH